MQIYKQYIIFFISIFPEFTRYLKNASAYFFACRCVKPQKIRESLRPDKSMTDLLTQKYRECKFSSQKSTPDFSVM